MDVDFGALIIDLETLVRNSKEDFSNKFWNSYETYVKTYNSLLGDIQSLGFYKKLKTIEPVPFSEQSFESGFSKTEKAKLREVVNASDVLLQKVKLLLSPPSEKKLTKQVRSNKVFVVPGSDKKMTLDVNQTLEKIDLDIIIIDETSNSKQSIVEIINEYPQVSFGVVLLSPDQKVYPKEKSLNDGQYQPNQNRIFQLGYLSGHLGSENVAAIYKKNLLIPNQYDEITWIEYKTGWYLKLIKHLQTCNFEVDANKLEWL